MSSNKVKVVCTWFVEPLNSYTNEMVSRAQEFLSEDNVCRGVICADGKSHNLLRCKDYSLISKLFRSKATDSSLSFRIWAQQGGATIRRWEFGEHHRQLRAQKKIMADLKGKI
jgi:hypothetical protein